MAKKGLKKKISKKFLLPHRFGSKVPVPPFFLPIILLWILLKLGDFGIGFIVFILSLFRFIVYLPFIFLYDVANLINSYLRPLRKRHRGRPPSRPVLVRYSNTLSKGFRRFIPTKFRIAVLIGVLFVAFFSYSIGLILIAHQLPSPENLSDNSSPLTTQIFDRNGNLLYRIYDEKNRSLVELDSLPTHLINATIAIEDKNYWGHPGVDLYGITRAGINFFNGGDLQGGSTLTQQLIKNTLLTPERTWQRKLKEVVLAFWAERVFSKKDILQMYFNEIPYGGPSWGIAAAAETYFYKEPSQLTLAESAYLAGLPVSPTTFSPYGSQPDLGKERQKQVLRRMVEDGYITQYEADEAFKQELDIKPKTEEIKAAHFVMYVREILSAKYGEKMLSQGGLQVVTTLDLDMQNKAEDAVKEEVEKIANLKVSNGAAMVTDAKTGQILVMVGSKNYWDPNGGNFNVTTSKRQPGSSIKPLTYAASFKEGFSPATIILDTPISYRNAWENYSPVNYDGRFRGAVTIRNALGSSYNIPAVKVLNAIGIDKLLQTSKDLGITTFTNPAGYGLSITLGGAEVRMVDMMAAYGTFSQMGKKYEIQPILKITDFKGQVLEDNTNPEGKKVLPSGVAYMIADILADNKARAPAFGTNSQLNIPGYTVAVKTGTTDSKRDNWTFGFTPDFVVGAWVGNNDNTPMDPRLTSGITGASPIWRRITKEILTDKPDVAFVRPADVIDGVVNGRKDLLLAGNIGRGSLPGERYLLSRDNRKNEYRDDDDNRDFDQTITFTDPLTTYTPN